MSDEKFKSVYGWDNPETWQIALLLQNDFYSHAEGLKKESKTWIDMSDRIKDLFTDIREDAVVAGNPSSVRIVANIGSFHRVNWDQLGRAFFTDH